MTKIAGSGSGSISQRHGSADPDPHQNLMDPEHCLSDYKFKTFNHVGNVFHVSGSGYRYNFVVPPCTESSFL
jgi:hypothetical protein